jgi:type I restriction enzyme S subunit
MADWKTVKLETVGSFQNGEAFSSAYFNFEKKGFRLVRNRDLKNDDQIVYYDGEHGDHDVVNDGDLLVGMDGDFTPVIWKKGKALLNQRVGRVLVKDRASQDYIYYALFSALAELEHVTSATTVKHLSSKTCLGLRIPLPPLAEQRKIAEILRTWDEAIETAEAELKAKHERKQWLIAKVLTSSSNEAGAVGVKKMPTERLGKLCDICTGKKDANEGSPDGVYPFFTCAERHGFSESYSFDTEAILVAGNANIGRTNYYKGKFEAYQRTYVLMGFRGVDVPYLYSLLSAKLELDLKNQAQRSAMSYIRLPMLEDYQIPLPPLAEQRKIAEILKCADMDIGSVDKYLESLRAQKRGLMQKLLTGEVRVAA